MAKLNNRRAWTPEEDVVLKSMHATNQLKDIAVVLHRPAGSVATRAAALGLSKHRDNMKPSEKSNIGTVVRPADGVLIHRARESNGKVRSRY